MTKFRISLTINAETLFRLMSNLLPIEDLHVEELGEGQPRVAPHPERLPAGPNLKEGINALIITHLSDGQPHRAIELKPILAAKGYSPNSIGSRLESLVKYKVVKSIGDGTWKLDS